MPNRNASIRSFYNGALTILRRWPIRAALLIILATALIKWQSTWMPEDTYVTPDPVPSINAKDFVNNATSLLSPQVSEIIPNGESLTDWPGKYKVFTLAQKDKIIEQNLPAFNELEAGFKYPFEEDPIRSFSTLFPNLIKARQLARALRVASEDRAAHGDWAGAVKYDLDGMQMAAQVQHGGVLISALVGVACDAIDRRDIYGDFDHLSVSQSLTAVARLRYIDSVRLQPYEVVANEERFCRGALLDSFHRDWRKELMWVPSQYGLRNDKVDLVTTIEIQTESPRTAYDNYTKSTDSLIAREKLPWPVQIRLKPLAIPTDPLNQILLPVLQPENFELIIDDTDHRLLETEIALHVYRLLHGTYPNTLQQLTPTIIPVVPNDPFSDNEPFKYRRQGGKYLLYSVGPDAKDDGGRPVYDTSLRQGDSPYRVWNEQEKGDVVAGINDNPWRKN